MPFDCKGAITSVAPRWKKWKKSFEYYVIAKGITNSARKKGLLLRCAGPEVQELFETLQDPGPAAEGEDVAECRRCHKVGYFAKVCQQKNFTSKNRFPSTEVSNKGRSNANSVDDGKMKAESDDDEYAFTVGGGNAGGMINVLVGGTSLQMLVDSGASTNVTDKGTWEELKSQRIECKSRKCEKKLYAYGSSVPLKVIGCFEAKVVLGDSVCEAEFVVIEGKGYMTNVCEK